MYKLRDKERSEVNYDILKKNIELAKIKGSKNILNYAIWRTYWIKIVIIWVLYFFGML